MDAVSERGAALMRVAESHVDAPDDLPHAWRARADDLARFAPAAAAAFRDAAAELEAALHAAANEVLTLQQASARSGLSVDRLRHKIADGGLPNAGRKGAPRLCARDLPVRKAPPIALAYDPNLDARRLASVDFPATARSFTR
jgi:hypothetical protein